MDKQRHEAEVEIIIPFHDVDMMEVAWHGHYVKYFEIARCALLDQIDYNYQQMKDSGYAWPVIDLRIRYPQSALFNQKVTARARVAEWENRLKIDYEIRDSASGRRLTRGHTIQVAVDIATREMCLESPPVLLEKLGVLP
ncbi:acyl-CoA thioesterase [Pseudomaricurvus alkylphenolicus]|jgi:acyl-CoA thioester hydrolase|uniref:acyl-CoA thioesterase n=1 Tax=Pseudomaricurvus alkylphenolicus TaxID=1306991 RepID=UPI00141DC356|nr:acyl-CoA thioesterase [Pseudomaricurvus alkylphenolicus]NIB44231.1 acyl-CoA thioesterase [Pseudomaricurvus alkylphenolicus]